MTRRFHTPTVRVNGKTQRAFRADLLRWYRRNRRQLPWRATRDPYAIWVSEIMLQQTRVETVIPYYDRWLRTFPSITLLARAPYSRVLKLWEGLGYYTRAKNLHRAAKLMTGRPLPSTVDEWHQLPGIGRYTAGAIASIAFDQRAPLVDGNVARVFARVFGLTGDVKLPATQKQLWSVAERLLPEKNCGDFNQALMELGALVCLPANPLCETCPLHHVCQALKTGAQNRLPVRGGNRPTVDVVEDTALMRRGDRILLSQRPATGLLANLWELPAFNHTAGALLATVRHTITHRRITLRVFESRPARRVTGPRLRWVTRREARQLALPAAHRRALEIIFSAQEQNRHVRHA
jgi:A/G-specific adenine glycosylase